MIRQKGSHRRYRISHVDSAGEVRTEFTTVPLHDRDMPIGTLRSIQRDLENALGKRWLL